MILYINTTDQKQVIVSLRNDGKIIDSLGERNKLGSQVLLPLIDQLLRTAPPGARNQLQTLEGIEVETGPGSFTGLRVGVSVANALGFALEIPVNSKKIETELVY